MTYRASEKSSRWPLGVASSGQFEHQHHHHTDQNVQCCLFALFTCAKLALWSSINRHRWHQSYQTHTKVGIEHNRTTPAGLTKCASSVAIKQSGSQLMQSIMRTLGQLINNLKSTVRCMAATWWKHHYCTWQQYWQHLLEGNAPS